MSIALKICGMKNNTQEVAALAPDYLGFIFYEGSLRNFDSAIPKLPKAIKKVGVFVDTTVMEISEKIKTYQLDVVQLHGAESPSFCAQLSKVAPKPIEIWKVFGIKDTFNFDQLEAYEKVVDKYLFDTKGKNKGGNGYTFNWSVLKKYPSKKPFVLSGGIGIDQWEALHTILKTDLPIVAIDVNSKFEIAPGTKSIELLSEFIELLEHK